MKKKLLIFIAFMFLGGVLWLFLPRIKTPLDRVLTFESHDPLGKDMSDADLKALFQMNEDCFKEMRRKNLTLFLQKYSGLDSVFAQKRADKLMENIAKDLPKDFASIDNAYVMRDRGQLIGYFSCKEENKLTHDSIMVFNVCVKKEKRGQGYGKELMLHSFKNCMKPGKDFTLLVSKDDTKVINFYKDLNFEIVSSLEEWEHLFEFFNRYLMKYKAPQSGESP